MILQKDLSEDLLIRGLQTTVYRLSLVCAGNEKRTKKKKDKTRKNKTPPKKGKKKEGDKQTEAINIQYS